MVTIFRVKDGRVRGIPIQVVLSVYQNVTQLLCSFDVDSCCFAYVPGRGVVCTRRGLRSVRHGVNVWDSEREGTTYAQRMEKWDARGFSIALPGLSKEKVSRHIRDANYYALSCGLLLRGDRPSVVALQATCQRDAHRPKDTLAQRCTVLRGFERLAGQKFGKVSRIDSRNENCMPTHVTCKGLVLVWTDQERHHQEEDSEYSCAPLESVGSLIQEIAARTPTIGDGEESCEFQWWLGHLFPFPNVVCASLSRSGITFL